MPNIALREDVEFANEANCVDYNNFNDRGKSGRADFSKKVRGSGKAAVRWLWVVAFGMLCGGGFSPNLQGQSWTSLPSFWETDYETAVQTAKDSSRKLLVYFHAERDSTERLNETEERFIKSGNSEIRQIAHVAPSARQPLPLAAACLDFENRTLYESTVLDQLDRFVLLKLPVEATVPAEDGNGSTPVLQLPMYQEMRNVPGLAVVDFENKDQPYYGQTVGILPFLRAKTPTTDETLTFLTLPDGTLSQRTLIYAVRVHRERPLSALGEPQPVLLKEARDHAAYQAKVRALGHQNFGSRTARIASALNCVGASEVCAQSWSGEGLFEAAIGCVRSWRGSSAHWKGVRASNRMYGYDMVRGDNRIWYAVGLFVK